MPYLLRRHYTAHECPFFLLRTPPTSPSTSSERLDADILADCRAWGWYTRYRFPRHTKNRFGGAAGKNKTWEDWTKAQERDGTKKELVQLWKAETAERARLVGKREEKRRAGVPVGWRENVRAYKAVFWDRWSRSRGKTTIKTKEMCPHGCKRQGQTMRNLKSAWSRAGTSGSAMVRTASFEDPGSGKRRDRDGDWTRDVRKRALSLDDVGIGRVSMETVSLDGSLEERLEAHRLERGRRLGASSDDASSSGTDSLVERLEELELEARRGNRTGYLSVP
ncbi:hypothetical protein K491DRAFT_157817 [Lophiostoma macrostomum CBS 122681]|uniref:Uncharacterized protein n=1 Tax=Lophiostoma macrostomum CBS 122681 TaxID=1314788 RepID=A0A6A6SSD5_9PLEO|nr:hypothetical protein K491DRAFT_157817 [Lophiostoma macrostomum CBS 122681]